jgi:murein DD-endopeptidase MepM/ murein hydrolase activator NlpD
VPPDPGYGSGGVAYGAALSTRPHVVRFAVTPRRVREDRAPRIVVRVDEGGATRVRARVDLDPRARGRATVHLPARTIRTGRTVTLAWPRGRRLRPGSYRVLLHVTDAAGATLARSRGASGVTTLTVYSKPKPKPVAPAPATPAPAVPAPVSPAPVAPTTSGVFPVAGPHTYGDGVGAAREGHTHQGQDILAAEGTPVVAPTAGTIAYVDYQAKAAGYYVVENAADGRAFFFAHCQKDSTVVAPGQLVAAGAPICRVGHTGDASGPHLHFEIWVGGWRVDKSSTWVDPLPQLRAWDHG